MSAVTEFLLLSGLTVIVPAAVSADILVFDNRVNEVSVTEITQEILILVCAIIFGTDIKRNRQSRGFLALVSGFFVCIFIRELDVFFDKFVCHGSWLFFALSTAAVSLIYAWKWRHTILPAMEKFVRSRAYYFILFGLVTVMVLSRTFGSGDLIWRRIDTVGEVSLVKTVIQEGLELFGYIIISYGSILYRMDKNRLS